MTQILSRRCPRCGTSITVELSDMKLSSALRPLQNVESDTHAVLCPKLCPKCARNRP